MIPPVEERQVRSCKDCVFRAEDSDGYYTNGFYCNLNVINMDYWDGVKTDPCKYHLTFEEMKEILDSEVIP